MDGELRSMRVIHCHELDPGLLQASQEMHIAGKPIELGNDQLGPCEPAELECLFELRAVGFLAALYLNELLHELPIAPIEIILDCLALHLDAEPGSPLARRGNPQIRDEFAPGHFVYSMLTGR